MKKFALILALVLSFGILTACGNDKKESFIMATEAGFAPYEYLDNNDIVGVDIDIANAIAKELGKELEVQNITFDGALLAVQQGKVDVALAGISVTDERKETMDFSIPYAQSKQVLVVKKDADIINGEEDIKADTKVGFQTGTTGMYYAEDTDCEAKGYTKYSQAALDLSNEKIDCIVMDELPAKEIVKANDSLVILEKELFTDEYAIAVKKGNQELLDKINPIIQKLIDDGKIDEYTLNHTKE